MSWKTKIESAKAVVGIVSFEGAGEFREEFPNLAELLLGCGESGSTDALPPFKLTLFVREGALRFSCSSDGFGFWGIGEVSDPTKGFLAIEETLAAGKVAWKIEKPEGGARRSRS